ncbi:carboxypeptidase N subunit 2 [Octodon degus]|uniref:Carboxypeptidase N subunit 2 n=1 Tax=Octodon degus TaxID=10160 RepID=A0A6P3FRX9_OCTDE|nr:carboxypeptidase N subunit 2 [Octodon degus]
MTPAGAWLCWASLLLLSRPSQSCPLGCDCFVHEVFCSDDKLAVIPPDIPPDTTDLVFVETAFTEVAPWAFGGSPNLTKLVFLNTQLRSFRPDAFVGLSQLRDLEVTGSTFNLSGNTFANLTSLGQLTLSFDKLYSLPKDLFLGLDTLESLQLQGNQLRTLPWGIFRSLRRLKSLNLGQNHLEWLPGGLLHPLSGLRFLRLSDNQLSQGLPRGIFATLRSLEELFLDSSALRELPPELFSGLFRLERLWLQHNAISHLPPTVFSDLGSLTSLSLQGNALRTLPADLFTHTPHLLSLSLSHNQLVTIAEGAFTNLSSLVSLTLSHNAIVQLPAGVFRDLQGLVKLYLGSNNLTALPPGLFHNLSSLELLNLSQNQLSTLPEGLFSTNHNLFNLALHGNPWQCDCHLAWLSSWLHVWSDPLLHINAYCAGPAYLRGQLMPSLKEEQLVCPASGHLGLDHRVVGGGWGSEAEDKAAWSRCTYSNAEGTVVLSCDEAQCRWLSVQLSPRQGEGFLDMRPNATQGWDLRSSCGSVRVTVSIEPLAAGP